MRLKLGFTSITVQYTEIAVVEQGTLQGLTRTLSSLIGSAPNVILKLKRPTVRARHGKVYLNLKPEDVQPFIDEVNRRVAAAS